MAEHAMYFTDDRAQRMYKIRKGVMNFFVYLFLSVFALFMLAPFVIMVVGSFINADNFEAFSRTADFENLGFAHWTIDNYSFILLNRQFSNFPVYFLNTLIVAVGGTTVTVVTAVLAAFAFARLEFKGKDALFALLLATMMIPGEMMVITNYQTVRSLYWTNTFAALILVHGVSVFYIFYLRQTFQQIPNELYLAAKVDGVGDLGYLIRVMVPIAMPTITTIIILSMMGSWNSYIWPNLVASGGWKYNPAHSMKLVSNGLRDLFAAGSQTKPIQDAYKIAGSMVISIPLLIVFILFRKYIMRGVSRSGIKG